MDPRKEYALVETRRQLFGRTATGIGTIALASLLNPKLFSAEPARPRSSPAIPAPSPGRTSRRRRSGSSISSMNGGPSQLDLFDYKPKMADWFDKDLPDSVRMGQRHHHA